MKETLLLHWKSDHRTLKCVNDGILHFLTFSFIYSLKCLEHVDLWRFSMDNSRWQRMLYSKKLFCRRDWEASVFHMFLMILCSSISFHFGPRVYPRGSLVIALVRWSMVRPSVGPSLNISETVDCFFLIFCLKLEYHKGTKVTEPDFWKKN